MGADTNTQDARGLGAAQGARAAQGRIELEPEFLGRLMPMSLWLDCDGQIVMLGPTLAMMSAKDQNLVPVGTECLSEGASLSELL